MRKILVSLFELGRIYCRRAYMIAHYCTAGRLYRSTSLFNYVSPLAHIRNVNAISLGKRVYLYRNVTIWCTSFCCGDDVSINSNCMMLGSVKIGSFVMFGPNVVVSGGNHGTEANGQPMFKQTCISKGITIGDDVWIGANVVILDGVEIGSGAVIGGGTVVTKSIPAMAVAVGNPARIIRYRQHVSKEEDIS